MFVDLSEKKIFVIGAGTIAKRRIRALSQFTDHVTVIAPEINPELRAMEEAGQIQIVKKQFENEDLCGADLVIAATSNHRINEEIYRLCKERQIPVNVCSDKKQCDFFFPGLAIKDDVVVGVTANGTNHKKAKTITEKIREILETCW